MKARRWMMNWPLEYEEKARLGGFCILDNDFDLMAGDMCNDHLAELGVKRICESARSVFKFVSILWPGSTRLKPA